MDNQDNVELLGEYVEAVLFASAASRSAVTEETVLQAQRKRARLRTEVLRRMSCVKLAAAREE